MALVPDISGVCSVFGTFEMTSNPTKAARTRIAISVRRSISGSSVGSARAWPGCRRMPGKDAGRVQWRSPCPDRGHSQAPAAPGQVRGDSAEGPLPLDHLSVADDAGAADDLVVEVEGERPALTAHELDQ